MSRNESRKNNRNPEIESRVKRTANYMLATGVTVREAAKEMGVSKSTIHRDMIKLLPEVAPNLVPKIQKLFEKNIIEGRKRGAAATRERYKKEGGDVVVDSETAKAAENF